MAKAKYYLHYIELASPKLKSFKSKESLDRFIKKIQKKQSEDYYVDFYFYVADDNSLVIIDDYYKDHVK